MTAPPSARLGPLSIDLDADAYVRLADALDEPAADALTDARERHIRATARAVVGREVVPRAARADREHRFVHESYQALASAGIAGLLVPDHLGGTGDSHVAYAMAVEEIAAGCAATSLVYMTQMHAAYPVMAAGTPELAQRYVPGLVTGELYGALAITEPDAGSDAARLRSVARRCRHGGGDRYVLSGSKTFITTGDRADVIVCFATVDPALGRGGVTAFVLDGRVGGLRRGAPFEKMGMHGSSTAELFFDDVEIPPDHRLGDEGSGWSLLTSSVVESRVSAAAQGVGLARAAYARTLCALDRLYGRAVPDEAEFALATMRGQILQGRLLLLAVARRLDTGGDAPAGEVAIMKQTCTDLGWSVAREATRVLGPHGDLAVLGVERCLRDAKVTQIYDGTNEVQRLLIARDTARTLRGRA